MLLLKRDAFDGLNTAARCSTVDSSFQRSIKMEARNVLRSNFGDGRMARVEKSGARREAIETKMGKINVGHHGAMGATRVDNLATMRRFVRRTDGQGAECSSKLKWVQEPSSLVLS